MLTQPANPQPNNNNDDNQQTDNQPINNSSTNNSPANNSYVNAYIPPQPSASQPADILANGDQNPANDQYNEPVGQAVNNDSNSNDGSTNWGEPINLSSATPTDWGVGKNDQAINDFNQAQDDASLASGATQDQDSESIEDQNIFELLGVNDGTDQEKEQFLDELQDVIWEDFLETDLELLVTEEEHNKIKDILGQTSKNKQEIQDEAVQFLEELIPDLEEIMLEKALELKEDMVRERIAGMREFYAGNTNALDQLNNAEELIRQDKWRSVAKVLNGIG